MPTSRTLEAVVDRIHNTTSSIVTSSKADANIIHNTENKLNNVTLNNQACQNTCRVEAHSSH